MYFSSLGRALEVYTALRDGDFDVKLEVNAYSAAIRENNGTDCPESFYVKVTNLRINSRYPEDFDRFRFVCKQLNVDYRMAHGSQAVMPESARLCRHCEASEVFERRFGRPIKEESHVQPV